MISRRGFIGAVPALAAGIAGIAKPVEISFGSGAGGIREIAFDMTPLLPSQAELEMMDVRIALKDELSASLRVAVERLEQEEHELLMFGDPTSEEPKGLLSEEVA